MATTKCSVCARRDREKIDAALRGGDAVSLVGSKYHVPTSTLARHAKNHVAPPKAAEPEDGAGPTLTPLPPSAPAIDVARERVAFLERAVNYAQKCGRPPKEVAHLYAQRTAAWRHLANVSGELELSEARILKSPKLRAIITTILEAVRPHREPLDAVTEALRRLCEEQQQGRPAA